MKKEIKTGYRKAGFDKIPAVNARLSGKKSTVIDKKRDLRTK